jgi:hypothetical protein
MQVIFDCVSSVQIVFLLLFFVDTVIREQQHPLSSQKAGAAKIQTTQ